MKKRPNNIRQQKVKMALIGLGYWGKNHLRVLSAFGVLSAAFDKDTKIVKQRRREYPGVRFTSDYKSILSDKEIKAVVLATPAATHYALTHEALKAGKDVLVEKPLALKAAEGAKLVKLAKEHRRILMVGHIFRHNPAVKKLKEVIKLGVIGKVQYIYSIRLNIGRLRNEENILWSFAPHDLSIMMGILDEEPIKVYAKGETFVQPGIHDVTLTQLEFKGGIKGHIFVSWLHPYKEQKMIVVGSKGMVVFDDLLDDQLRVYPHKIKINPGTIPIVYKAKHRSIKFTKAEPLKEEIRHFIDCVRKRKTPLTDGAEGYRVLKVLEKATKCLSK